MMTQVHVGFEVAAVAPDSPRALEVAGMFGLGLDPTRRITIIPPTEIELPIEEGGVVFITGPSGGGKSTLLTQIAQQIRSGTDPVVEVLHYDESNPLPDQPLVDVLDASLEDSLALLARVGLAEASLLLRRPCELSEGQRHRLRLALLTHRATLAIDVVAVLADEFGATLDRVTARIVAQQLSRWARNRGVLLVVASAHDELLEDLDPEVLIWKGLGDAMEVMTR